MRDTPTTVQSALRVETVLEPLSPWLSERARAVFANLLPEPSPSLVYFGALYTRPESQVVKLANYQDFAERLNYVVEQFDGRPRQVQGEPVEIESNVSDTLARTGTRTRLAYARITAAIAPPMEIPLTGERVMLAAYVFLEDAPQGAYGKAWVNAVVGRRLRCALEAELVENPPDLPTPPEPPPVDVRAALRARGML